MTCLGDGSQIRAALVLLAALAPCGCRDPAPLPTPAPAASEPSPNASILPGPLAPEDELLAESSLVSRDAGPTGSAIAALGLPPRPPPERLPENRPVDADPLPGPGLVGLTLDAQWQWHGLPSPPSTPEVAKDTLVRLRSDLVHGMRIDLSPLGRLRIQMTGRALVPPRGTELLGRDDFYGHIVVWSERRRYRVVPVGSLRAMLEEGRVDVLPTLGGTSQVLGSGQLLGFETTRSSIQSQLGKLTVEQAAVPGGGAGAPLLCRFLVELVGVVPSSDVCQDGLLPLRADFKWAEKGELSFLVTALLRGQELRQEHLTMPPTTALFKPDELPTRIERRLIERADLFALRTRDLEPADPPDAGAPSEGLIATNRADLVRYLLVDGLPAALVGPQDDVHLVGLRRGRYVTSWRDFLGTEVSPPQTSTVPGRLDAGEIPDGGTPPL